MQSTGWTRRKKLRRKCNIPTRFYVGSRPAVACVIEDITPDGARVSAEEYVRASTRLLIFISLSGELRPAEVRWRRKQTFGIQFIRDADFAGAEHVGSEALLAMRLQTDQMAMLAHRSREE